MKTIWKYIIYYGQNEYEMPKGAKILSAQLQDDNICIWALVEPENEKEVRIIEIFGTGWPLDLVNTKDEDKYKFIVTIQRGGFVQHLFEIIK